MFATSALGHLMLSCEELADLPNEPSTSGATAQNHRRFSLSG
jgi:hypothetical protein